MKKTLILILFILATNIVLEAKKDQDIYSIQAKIDWKYGCSAASCAKGGWWGHGLGHCPRLSSVEFKVPISTTQGEKIIKLTKDMPIEWRNNGFFNLGTYKKLIFPIKITMNSTVENMDNGSQYILKVNKSGILNEIRSEQSYKKCTCEIWRPWPFRNYCASKSKYTLTATVIVDDPPSFEFTSKNDLCDYETLRISTGDFKDNDNYCWFEFVEGKRSILVVPRVKADSTYEFSFKDIIKDKKSSTKYFKNIGKKMKVRLLKVLNSGDTSFTSFSDFTFYPTSPSITAQTVIRTSCNDLILKVKIEDENVTKYTMGGDSGYHFILSNWNGQDVNGSFRCSFIQIDTTNIYRVDVLPPQSASEVSFKDLIDQKTKSSIWKLQLLKNGESRERGCSTEANFSIPKKPSSVQIEKFGAYIDASLTTYNGYKTSKNSFSMKVKIFDKLSNRYPYTIENNDGVIVKTITKTMVDAQDKFNETKFTTWYEASDSNNFKAVVDEYVNDNFIAYYDNHYKSGFDSWFDGKMKKTDEYIYWQSCKNSQITDLNCVGPLNKQLDIKLESFINNNLLGSPSMFKTLQTFVIRTESIAGTIPLLLFEKGCEYVKHLYNQYNYESLYDCELKCSAKFRPINQNYYNSLKACPKVNANSDSDCSTLKNDYITKKIASKSKCQVSYKSLKKTEYRKNILLDVSLNKTHYDNSKIMYIMQNTGITIDNLSTLIQTLTLYDKNGCKGEKAIKIKDLTLAPELILKSVIALIKPHCGADTSGEVELVFTGGVKPKNGYSYYEGAKKDLQNPELKYSDDKGVVIITGLSSKTYFVTVSDVTGQKKTFSYSIGSSDGLKIGSAVLINNYWEDSASVKITPKLSEGASYIAISGAVETTSSENVIKNLTKGKIYKISLKNNNCESSNDTTIYITDNTFKYIQPSDKASPKTIIHSETLEGEGSVKISAFVGDVPKKVKFIVYDASENFDISINGTKQEKSKVSAHTFKLPGGIYKIKIIDTKLKVFTKQFVIETPNPIINFTEQNDVIKKGGSDGSISISLSDKNYQRAYKYKFIELKTNSVISSGTINNGKTNIKIDKLKGVSKSSLNNFSHKLILTDTTNSKFKEFFLKIVEPDIALSCSHLIAYSPTCNNEKGVIKLNPKGGWGGYTVELSDKNIITGSVIDNTFHLRALDLGKEYEFIIKDSRGGVVYDTVSYKDFPNPSKIILFVDSLLTLKDYKNDGNGQLGVKIDLPINKDQIDSIKIEGFKRFKNGAILSKLYGGKHSVTIKTDFGCEVTQEFELELVDTLKFNLVRVIDHVCELDTGRIAVVAQGGTGPYTYFCEKKIFDDKTKNTSYKIIDTKVGISYKGYDIDSLKTGEYKIIIQDSKLYSIDTTIYIKNYVNPAIKITKRIDVNCYGQQDGEIEVVDLHKTYNYNVEKTRLSPIDSLKIFRKDNFASSKIQSFSNKIINNLDTGSYYICVVDTMGCWSDNYYTKISQPDTFLIENFATRNIVTKGENNGEVRFSTSGGNVLEKTATIYNKLNQNLKSKKNYFSNNGKNLRFKTLMKGDFKLKVVDSKLCSDSVSFIIKEPTEKLSLGVVSMKQSGCKSTTGEVEIKGVGGWEHYSYSRYPEEIDLKKGLFTNLNSGEYKFSVKDTLGNTFDSTIVVAFPDTITSNIKRVIKYPSYYNTTDGEIEISIKGGLAPYSILNNNKYENTNIVKVKAGYQKITIKDANGCIFKFQSFKIDAPKKLVVSSEVVKNSSCGSSNGEITANITGGVGKILLTCADVNGKIKFVFKDIDILPNKIYSKNIPNLPSNIYILKVKDEKNHKDTVYVSISSFSVYFNIVEKNSSTEFGANNGVATIFVRDYNNGYEIYSDKGFYKKYSKTDKDKNFRCSNDTIYLTNLCKANYFIKMTDNNSCVTICDFRINEPDEFKIYSSQVINCKTKGSRTGKITITTGGGNGNNTFKWEKIGSLKSLQSFNTNNSSTISNKTAGIYKVKITDKLGFSISSQDTILEPQQDLELKKVSKYNATCRFYTNGIVNVKASGGWGDYQYRSDTYGVNDFVNQHNFKALDVRKHKFYTKDLMGVIDTLELDITQPDSLLSKVLRIDSVNCKSGLDGEIHLNIAGGTQPYKYKFEEDSDLDFKFGTTVKLLKKGKYSIIISDTNNCFSYDTVRATVLEPDSLLINKIKVIHSTCNLENGKIFVSLKGGTPTYNYRWYKQGDRLDSNRRSISKLSGSKNYTIKVEDKNKCTSEKTIYINYSKNPVITNIVTTQTLCWGDSTGVARAVISPAIPNAPYIVNWNHTAKTGSVMGGLWKSKDFFVTVVDTNKCMARRFFEVSQPDSISISTKVITNAQCFGYNNGEIIITPKGGVGEYSYLWSNGDTISYASKLYKGDYNVVITDSNKCSYTKYFRVEEPNKIIVNLGGEMTVCEGQSIELDAGFYDKFKWNSESDFTSTDQYVNISKAEEYYLKVTDTEGCIGRDTFDLYNSNTVLQADFLVPSTVRKGDTIIIYEISNNVPDSISWRFSNEKYIPLDQGSYWCKILVTDSSDCTIVLTAIKAGCRSEASKLIKINSNNTIFDFEREKILGAKKSIIKTFSVSPNPVPGIIKIKIELREEKDIKIKVYQINTAEEIGQLKNYNSDTYSEEFDFSYYPNGLYLLILETGNERRRVKVVVTK